MSSAGNIGKERHVLTSPSATPSLKHSTERRKVQNKEAQRKQREKLKNHLGSLELEAAQLVNDGLNSSLESVESGNQGQDLTSSFLIGDQLLGLPLEQHNVPNSTLHSQDLLPSLSEPHPQSFGIGEVPNLEPFTSIWSDACREQITQSSEASDILTDDANFDSYFDQIAEIFPPDSSNPSLMWSNMPITYPEQAQKSKKIQPHVKSNCFPACSLQAASAPKCLLPSLKPKSSIQVYKHTKSPSTSNKNALGSQKITTAIIHQLRLNDTNENRSLVKTAVARGYNIRDVFLAGFTSLGQRSSPDPQESSDLHINKLDLVRTPTMQAYLSIAKAMSINIEDLFCESFKSPFYQPKQNTADNFAAFSLTYGNLSPHLRPTPARLLYPHHPWIDLLPFPTLRERAIAYVSTTPPAFNISELKNDIFTNNGMFCWKVSEKEGGVPWDMRSWEFEPWFLEKWEMLLSGGEEEVWRQTSWWRRIRGEDKI